MIRREKPDSAMPITGDGAGEVRFLIARDGRRRQRRAAGIYAMMMPAGVRQHGIVNGTALRRRAPTALISLVSFRAGSAIGRGMAASSGLEEK